MQQIADRAAESGVDVLYISTELSRYDLMVDTVSRLSYEMNKKDEEKAVSSMAIMTGEKGADIRSLKDELNCTEAESASIFSYLIRKPYRNMSTIWKMLQQADF